MKKWIFYALIFTVVGVAFPLLNGDGGSAGRALVSGLGVTFLVIVLYLIQLGWTKFFGSLASKSVKAIDQTTPPTKYPVPSPIHTSLVVDIQKIQQPVQAEHSPSNFVALDEDAIYTIVAEELESGKTDKGLWTRLFAECKGDEKQVKVQYIARRVTKLLAAETHKKEQFAFDESVRQKQLKIAEVETERLRRQNAGLADPGLIWAVSHGNWASAKQLLVNGVSPFGMNDDGITLLDIAKKMRDQDMINLLIAHGALE